MCVCVCVCVCVCLCVCVCECVCECVYESEFMCVCSYVWYGPMVICIIHL